MNGNPAISPVSLLPRGPMVRGLALFLLLSAGGLAALYGFSSKADARQILAGLSPGFLVLAILSAVADTVIGAIRYQVFLRRIRPGTSLMLPIRADLANRFLGAVTPSQSGGGPAQVFILWRGGIPVPDALSFLLINFISTLVFFLVAGGFAAWVFRSRFPDGTIHGLVHYGFIAFLACVLLMLVALLRPGWMARPLAWNARRLQGRGGASARAGQRCCAMLASCVDQYRAACTRFIRDYPLLPVMSFALTLLIYLNKFTLAWLIMRGLGVNGDYVTTLGVQALLHFILFVAPSPGASGIAEVGTGALMAVLMPGHLLAPFTAAYRFLLLYLPAALGAVVLMRELPVRAARRRPAPAGLDARRHAPARGRVAAALAIAMLLTPARAGAQGAPGAGGEHADSAACAHVRALVVQGLLARDDDAADGFFRESVECARELVDGAPGDPESHYLLSVSLGYYLEHKGIREKLQIAGEVRVEAQRALEIDPTHAGAHHIMGRLYAGAMRLGSIARFMARKFFGASAFDDVSWEMAEYHFREARRYDDASPRHAMELGAVYADTDRVDLARSALLDATALAPAETADSLACVRAGELLAQLPRR